jgi:hypothetical protein
MIYDLVTGHWLLVTGNQHPATSIQQPEASNQ